MGYLKMLPEGSNVGLTLFGLNPYMVNMENRASFFEKFEITSLHRDTGRPNGAKPPHHGTENIGAKNFSDGCWTVVRLRDLLVKQNDRYITPTDIRTMKIYGSGEEIT